MMLPSRSPLLGLTLALAALVTGCGTRDTAPINPCTPGLVVSCPCVGGGEGIQTCASDGTFDACACDGATDPDASVLTDTSVPDATEVTDTGGPDTTEVMDSTVPDTDELFDTRVPDTDEVDIGTEEDTAIVVDTGVDDTSAEDTNVLDTAPEDTCLPDVELCDGLDNDCDGLIDEDGVCDSPCPPDMIEIAGDALSFCVDAYEASRQDATASSAGTSRSLGPSRPGVIPWQGAPYALAEELCQSVGRRLCTDTEWKRACGGDDLWTFPYSRTTWDATACNVGGSADGYPSVAPTGALSQCVSPDGPFDMSGNVAEWVGDTRMTRGGGYAESAEFNLRCTRPSGQAVDVSSPPDQVGFRCCANASD